MLVDVLKESSSSVMGIDCSTQRLAFGIITDGELVKWGLIEFDGKNVFDRIKDARKKIDALIMQFPVDYVAIESAIMVKSIQVAIKMAYVFGAVMSSLLIKDIKVVEVAPISWQSFIGNKTLTKQEKQKIKLDNPNKSASWYTNKNRLVRKDRTRQWVKNTFDLDIESDDITDSIGIAYFAWNKTKRRI